MSRHRSHREFSRFIAAFSVGTLPCFYGCGCQLPAGDDATSTQTRRDHLETCPIAVSKRTLKDRTSTLIAQNPAHTLQIIKGA